jgi:hypothetical protein
MHYKLVFNEKEEDMDFAKTVLIEADKELRGFKKYVAKRETWLESGQRFERVQYQIPPEKVLEAIEKGGRYRVEP